VRLSCEPPVYDEAQLTSLILAGRAGGERVAVRELNRQISGLLSAVVIRKIQEQLAPGLPVDVERPLDQQSYAEFSAAPLEVGRFVSDRIYVRYEQRYGGSRLGDRRPTRRRRAPTIGWARAFSSRPASTTAASAGSTCSGPRGTERGRGFAGRRAWRSESAASRGRDAPPTGYRRGLDVEDGDRRDGAESGRVEDQPERRRGEDDVVRVLVLRHDLDELVAARERPTRRLFEASADECRRQ